MKKLTNPDGAIISNDDSSITLNQRGNTYTFLEDKQLIEKIAHFVRERIPERVVHAKGAGAFGYFECTKDMSKYTKASLFTNVGTKTPLLIRFSTVGGESGSADSARDPRGFAIKFYTDSGNYDIVGNNTPIFFIRDGMKFPDFIHTQKRNPKTHLKDANMMWDFLSACPESLHQTTILFSDYGTPKDYRHMHGYSSHAFMWYTNQNNYCWVKYHFLTDQKSVNNTDKEAIKMAGENPDYATQDLYDAIKNNDFPSWTVYVQIMDNKDIEKLEFDPFDVTKVWLHKDYPLIEIGKIVLNKNPDDYFAQIEQAAFSPARFIDGIAASPDKLLQARLFAYEDAQRYRLGVNYQQIPVNRPNENVCPYSHQRDGAMVVNNNYNGTYAYTPNTLEKDLLIDKSYNPPMINFNNVSKGRFNQEYTDYDFYQPKLLFEKTMNETARKHLIENMADSLKQANVNLQYRWLSVVYKASEKYASMLNDVLKLDWDKIVQLSKLDNNQRIEQTRERKIICSLYYNIKLI